MKRQSLPILILFLVSSIAGASQKANQVSKVWVADLGNGTYKNPIIHADYSDPDAIRVGNDYFLVSSSFEDIPGLPILHSKDLVNWSIIGHALLKQPPYDVFSKIQHGNGVWAPSIRYHKGEFYIYYPDPDYGIYMTKAKEAAGPWSEPLLVAPGKGLIDPCPFWDDDGDAYLVHAWAGSRAGIKSIITLNKMNAEGTKLTDEGTIIYDGHVTDPTIEGPKIYKRNGYYYIFAPAGGVSNGWQLALRSRNIYGPYERKIVMDQGRSTVNGPHQGAWVSTQTGENWFLHFQDKGVYGRVLHLQPMKWIGDWPVIGQDADGDGRGEPVMNYKKPNVGRAYSIMSPAETDEFNESRLGLQWQWMANPKAGWYFMNASEGTLRLYAARLPDSVKNDWFRPNILLQKFPAETFMATVKIRFTPNERIENEKAGLVVMGFSYAGLALKKKDDGLWIVYTECRDAVKGNKENEKMITKIRDPLVYFRVKVMASAKCQFAYSLNGTDFTDAGDLFQAEAGRWVGAKLGLFCSGEIQTNDAGYADIDWFRIAALQ